MTPTEKSEQLAIAVERVLREHFARFVSKGLLREDDWQPFVSGQRLAAMAFRRRCATCGQSLDVS